MNSNCLKTWACICTHILTYNIQTIYATYMLYNFQKIRGQIFYLKLQWIVDRYWYFVSGCGVLRHSLNRHENVPLKHIIKLWKLVSCQ